MRVVIDALASRDGGGQRYVRNLLSFDPPEDIEVFLLAPETLKIPKIAKSVVRIPVAHGLTYPFARSIWYKTGLNRLLKKLHADVLFTLGPLPVKVPEQLLLVARCANMLPFDPVQIARYPLGYRRVRLKLLTGLWLRTLLASDLVIFVSEHAREVITGKARGRLRRAVVVYNGVERASLKDVEPERSVLPAEKCLLYVSRLEPYKSHLELVRAFHLLGKMWRGAEHLVLIGPEWSRSYSRSVRREIERLGLQSKVHLLGALPSERLKTAYREARIGVFMSECESCPNILLEAMAAGSPMVVSARMPMPEFAGDAVLYADPAQPTEVAGQMARLLADSNLQRILGELGKQRVELFNTEAEAKKTWESIAAAVNARRSQEGVVRE